MKNHPSTNRSPDIDAERETLNQQMVDIRERLTDLLKSPSHSRSVLVDCLHDSRMVIRSISLPEPENEVIIDGAASAEDQLARENQRHREIPRFLRRHATNLINSMLNSPNETSEQIEDSIRSLIGLTKEVQDKIVPNHIGDGGALRDYPIEFLPPRKVLDLRDHHQNLNKIRSALSAYPHTDQHPKPSPSVYLVYESLDRYGLRHQTPQPDNTNNVLTALASGDPRAAFVLMADSPDESPALVVAAMTDSGPLPGHVIMVRPDSSPLVVDLSRAGVNTSPEAIYGHLRHSLRYMNTATSHRELMEDMDHLGKSLREIPTDNEIAVTYGRQAMQIRLSQIAAKVGVPTAETKREDHKVQRRLMELAHCLGMEQTPLTLSMPSERGNFTPDSQPPVKLDIRCDAQTQKYHYTLTDADGVERSRGSGQETYRHAYQAGLQSAREFHSTGHNLPTLAVRQPEYTDSASGYQVIGLTGDMGEMSGAHKIGHWMSDTSRASLTRELTPEQIVGSPHWQRTTEKLYGGGRPEGDREAIESFFSKTLNPDTAAHADSLSADDLLLAGTDDSKVRLPDYVLRYSSDEDIRMMVEMQVQLSTLPANEKASILGHLKANPNSEDWVRLGGDLDNHSDPLLRANL